MNDNMEFEHDSEYTYIWCWDSIAEDADGKGVFYMFNWADLRGSVQVLEGTIN